MSSPFTNKTPESYFAGLRRKDSKNALTTCHGVTDKGRACRRALASPKNSSKFDGVVVITANVEDPAIYFCWQHKGQADTLYGYNDGSIVSTKDRHSLEEAFRTLGLDDVDEEREVSSKEPSPSPLTPQVQIPEPANTVLHDYDRTQSGSHGRSRPSGYSYEKHRHPRARYERGEHPSGESVRPRRLRSELDRNEASKSAFNFFTCCFGAGTTAKRDRESRANRNPYPVSRPVPTTSNQAYRHENSRHEMSKKASVPNTGERSPRTPADVRRKDVSSHRKSDSGIAMRTWDDSPSTTRQEQGRELGRSNVVSQSRNRLNVYRDTSPTPGPRDVYQRGGDPKSDSLLGVPDHRPLKSRSKSAPDAQQLQIIHGEWPPMLPRDATDGMRLTYAKILTVMSEQPSRTDTPGYIYVFWQTELEQTDDETLAVASIISAPKLDRGLQRQETILQRRFFQTSANARLPDTEKRTIFLKIGRAANVHSRLSQWKKQCEYEISLLRSYPYDSQRRGKITQVPNVVKVERLIHLHLEMLGQRVSKQCRCGTEHKEWFEVEATAKGIREVDEIVRRWVRWSEEKFS